MSDEGILTFWVDQLKRVCLVPEHAYETGLATTVICVHALPVRRAHKEQIRLPQHRQRFLAQLHTVRWHQLGPARVVREDLLLVQILGTVPQTAGNVKRHLHMLLPDHSPRDSLTHELDPIPRLKIDRQPAHQPSHINHPIPLAIPFLPLPQRLEDRIEPRHTAADPDHVFRDRPRKRPLAAPDARPRPPRVVNGAQRHERRLRDTPVVTLRQSRGRRVLIVRRLENAVQRRLAFVPCCFHLGRHFVGCDSILQPEMNT